MTATAGPAGHAVATAEARLRVGLELDFHSRCGEKVYRLTTDPTFRSLSRDRLAGETARQWDAVHTEFGLVRRRMDKWETALNDARRLVGTSHDPVPRTGAPTGATLVEVGRILNDPSIALTREEMSSDDRPPPEAADSERVFSLAYVRTVVEASLETVWAFVRHVSATRAACQRRIDQLTAGIAGIEAEFGTLPDHQRTSLTDLRRRVDEAGAAVAADPLALAGGETAAAAPGQVPLRELEEELARVRSLLRSTAATDQPEPDREDRRRAALRDRLELYGLRAARGGFDTDRDLAALWEAAWSELRAVPFDRAAAEQTVHGYSSRVWRLESERGEL